MAHLTVKGVYDLHVHSGPDLFDRIGDEAEIAAMCRDAGMAGVLFKVHHESTVARAYYASKLSPGIECHSSICLNRGVGGINPGSVETAVKMGAKIVWMPTSDSAYHELKYGVTGAWGHVQDSRLALRAKAISLLDDKGKLVGEIQPVLGLIARHNVVLATGHISPEETELLIPAALEAGVKKIVLTHVNFTKFLMPLERVKGYVGMGAMAELCAPSQWGGYLGQEDTRDWIEALGADNCFISSDAGISRKPAPHEAIRTFLYVMSTLGISLRDLHVLSIENPRRLLEG
ncbi:MAG: hypothetical protein EHM35_09650 [Planctomycetaceae bacterium]|nr:MAG: hypothetical protein EHM35_09650 [Planctomycetaceae bacterium]